MTELQLKNESLQSKLSDEIANQKEIQRKLVLLQSFNSEFIKYL